MPVNLNVFPFRGVLVKKAADQTTADYVGFALMAFDDEDFDTDGFHDNVTNNTRLTIPSGLGITKVYVYATITPAAVTVGEYHSIRILKNGALTGMPQARLPIVLTTNNPGNVGGVVACADGDYFEVSYAMSVDNSITITAASTRFGLMVVG